MGINGSNLISPGALSFCGFLVTRAKERDCVRKTVLIVLLELEDREDIAVELLAADLPTRRRFDMIGLQVTLLYCNPCF